MPERIILNPGQKFGRLTVISLHHISIKKDEKRIRKRFYYLCKCDCGKEIVVEKWNLKTNHTISCGCFSNELKRHFIHGLSKNRIYGIWGGIKNRCLNKNEPIYCRYGGRGITVCDEWRNDFTSFYNWSIENGYREDLTIDRIDNNGNYEPSNCRWVTMKEQCSNRSSTRILLYKGEKHCAMEWANKLGIKYVTLIHRLERGWPVEKAFEYK